MRRPARKASGGFGLVEAIIAITVCITALTAAIQAQWTARRMIDEGRETQIATGLLRSQMDLVELSGRDDVWDGSAGFVDGQPVAGAQLAPLQDASVTFTTPGSSGLPAAPDVLVVSLRLEWRALSGGTRSLQITSALR